jgi:hypothetical protein
VEYRRGGLITLARCFAYSLVLAVVKGVATSSLLFAQSTMAHCQWSSMLHLYAWLSLAQASLTSISPWGGNQFTARNISLVNLLSIAYNIDGRYITGIPKQLRDASFTVLAKLVGDHRITYDQIHAPLQVSSRNAST